MNKPTSNTNNLIIEVGYINDLDITVIFDFTQNASDKAKVINFYYGTPNQEITNDYVKDYVTEKEI